MIPCLIIVLGVLGLNAVIVWCCCLDLQNDSNDLTKEVGELRRDLTQLKRRLDKVGTLTYFVGDE